MESVTSGGIIFRHSFVGLFDRFGRSSGLRAARNGGGVATVAQWVQQWECAGLPLVALYGLCMPLAANNSG